MSVETDLLAFGPFSADIIDCLAYPDTFYLLARVQPGEIVWTKIIPCPTRDISTALAEALGFGLWDLGKHWIEKLSIDQLAGLKAFLRDHEYQYGEFVGHMWDEIQRLHKAGFKWLFMVQG